VFLLHRLFVIVAVTIVVAVIIVTNEFGQFGWIARQRHGELFECHADGLSGLGKGGNGDAGCSWLLGLLGVEDATNLLSKERGVGEGASSSSAHKAIGRAAHVHARHGAAWGVVRVVAVIDIGGAGAVAPLVVECSWMMRMMVRIVCVVGSSALCVVAVLVGGAVEVS